MPLTKAKFRQTCLKKMKNSSHHDKFYRNALLNLQLLNELKKVTNKKILFFCPLPFEANIMKTLLKMRKKCDIFVPFMQSKSFKMVPFRLPLKKINLVF